MPLQTVWPCGQTHCPETHDAPVAQAVPHVPQLFVSLERSAHPPVHATSPVPQVQTPAMHVAPVPQTLPQVPQLKLSVDRSEHFPLQFVGADEGHAH